MIWYILASNATPHDLQIGQNVLYFTRQDGHNEHRLQLLVPGTVPQVRDVVGFYGDRGLGPEARYKGIIIRQQRTTLPLPAQSYPP